MKKLYVLFVCTSCVYYMYVLAIHSRHMTDLRVFTFFINTCKSKFRSNRNDLLP